jgi:hypothetical protein
MDININWLLEHPIAISIFECYVNTHVWIMKQDFAKWLNNYNFAKCVEPTEIEWSSICSLVYQYKYDMCYTYDEHPRNIQSEYGKFYTNRENKYGFGSNPFEVLEHLFMAKQNNKYFIRTYFPGHKPLENPIHPNTSKVNFIFVEYNHPKMSSSIELKIPEGMWMEGNELFTSAFVLRQLQHQGEYYYFDMNYILKILDSSVVEFTLNSRQYIVIQSDKYIIQTI